MAALGKTVAEQGERGGNGGPDVDLDLDGLGAFDAAPAESNAKIQAIFSGEGFEAELPTESSAEFYAAPSASTGSAPSETMKNTAGKPTGNRKQRRNKKEIDTPAAAAAAPKTASKSGPKSRAPTLADGLGDEGDRDSGKPGGGEADRRDTLRRTLKETRQARRVLGGSVIQKMNEMGKNFREGREEHQRGGGGKGGGSEDATMDQASSVVGDMLRGLTHEQKNKMRSKKADIGAMASSLLEKVFDKPTGPRYVKKPKQKGRPRPDEADAKSKPSPAAAASAAAADPHAAFTSIGDLDLTVDDLARRIKQPNAPKPGKPKPETTVPETTVPAAAAPKLSPELAAKLAAKLEERRALAAKALPLSADTATSRIDLPANGSAGSTAKSPDSAVDLTALARARDPAVVKESTSVQAGAAGGSKMPTRARANKPSPQLVEAARAEEAARIETEKARAMAAEADRIAREQERAHEAAALQAKRRKNQRKRDKLKNQARLGKAVSQSAAPQDSHSAS